MTDRAQNAGMTGFAWRPPLLPAALLAATAIAATALAAGPHWAAGGFALLVSGLFALIRKVPDSNELYVPLPAGAEAGDQRR